MLTVNQIKSDLCQNIGPVHQEQMQSNISASVYSAVKQQF